MQPVLIDADWSVSDLIGYQHSGPASFSPPTWLSVG
jgi:hypothetical protein